MRKLLSVSALLLILDAGVKYWVSHLSGAIPIFKDFLGIDFSIVHVENKGAIIGLLSAWPKLLFWFRVVIALFLIYYIIFHKQNRWPIALIIVGAVGNILDCIFYGSVIDMFYFRFWGFSYPVFNLADSYITVALIWLLLPKRKHEN